MSPESQWARGQEAPPDVLPLGTTDWGRIRYTPPLNPTPAFCLTPLQIPGSTSGKEAACQCRRPGKIPWRRAWRATPVFLPGASHGQRSLEHHSSQGHKEWDTTKTT